MKTIIAQCNKNFFKNFQCVLLPPNRGVRGVDFPISMTINSTIFSFVTVNHAQDLMCLKFEALLMNKQHPNDPSPAILFCNVERTLVNKSHHNESVTSLGFIKTS